MPYQDWAGDPQAGNQPATAVFAPSALFAMQIARQSAKNGDQAARNLVDSFDDKDEGKKYRWIPSKKINNSIRRFRFFIL